MLMDNLGQLYELMDEDVIRKYAKNGHIQYEYRHPELLSITSIDVTDPYKIGVFYRDQQEILLLDNTLNPLSTLQLKSLENTNFTAFSRSMEGDFWLYESNQQKLFRIDNGLNVLAESFPLYQEGIDHFSPIAFEISQNRLVVGDTNGTVLVFDHLANYLNRLDLPPFLNFHLIDNRLLLIRNDGVYLYDFESFETIPIAIEIRQEIRTWAIDHQNEEIIFYVGKDPLNEYMRVRIP